RTTEWHKAEFLKLLSSRIAYWQAESLAPSEETEGTSSHRRIQALEAEVDHLKSISAVRMPSRWEARAIAADAEMREAAKKHHKQAIPQTATEATQQETIATQLGRLREESRLTVERLSVELRINKRSVERHLAGKTIPRIGQIGAY